MSESNIEKPVFVIGLDDDDEFPSYYTVVLTKEDADKVCAEYNCGYSVRDNSEFAVDVLHYYPNVPNEENLNGDHYAWEAAYKKHLEAEHFERVGWSTGERDSHGPVTRVCTAFRNGYRYRGLI